MICVSSLPVGRSFCAEAKWGGAAAALSGTGSVHPYDPGLCDKRCAKIIVDDEATYHTVEELLQDMGLTEIRTEWYQEKEDLFTHYGLNEEIASISDRVVPLPGGGSLVFDYTEAMTVIDVNSGHYSTGSDREETSLATNREAALEIARQLRLRDIGGIIVADFIDMERKEEQEEILDLLRREFAMDRMKPRVMGMTALNLVEMTRMKARRNLFGTVYTTCPMCQGSGRVESPETVYVEIRRRCAAFISIMPWPAVWSFLFTLW